ncbi:hypothetical protein J3R03_008773 [Actinoplanes couchii]|uniref:Uncharacterized protein n=1 Tax=Actinoplanes couchii TaxID=403638 RepID=A0ABQ3XI20_9ACTN|nr:hypothetical protein [Actinoplanes couchii]GID58129.1 hypothetical protein Aco03nite_065330 [Actinoplanes couchii]
MVIFSRTLRLPIRHPGAKRPELSDEAALVVLLEVVESVERGLDEVSGRMRETLTAIHAGRAARLR